AEGQDALTAPSAASGPREVGGAWVKARARSEHRAVDEGADRGARLAGLAAWAAGVSGAGVAVGRSRPVGEGGFGCAGEGAQWVG
ncbi:polyketide synthase, partial [Mycobacterium tuberculosis]|nr:polyketide synthase [Mycobacterium tuberculosis]